jgi:glycosyltransferase involved in cell wall biosynthesis
VRGPAFLVEREPRPYRFSHTGATEKEMLKPKKYDSALRDTVRSWVNDVGTLDILVGIPCYNSEDTIGHVVSVCAEGLNKHYPDKKNGIIVSDGGSLDDTRERSEDALTPAGVEKAVAIYRGVPGKGTSFRAVFEAAKLTKADACIVVDSDLRSITPEWIKALADPILKKEADFIAPYYSRHKYDGTITNNLVYPLTRSLYGLRVRQPIGGDFGFCGELANFYFREDVWETDVAKFGIDIWMSTSAICEGYQIGQVYLGRKIHMAKDPADDLGPMFQQVISTLFFLMGKYEKKWRMVNGSQPVKIVSRVSEEAKLEPLSVSQSKLMAEFEEGFSHFDSLYRQILEPENYTALKRKAKKLKDKGTVDFPSDLWARIVYDFAFLYQTWNRNRRRLVDILTPLYFGRTASYCQEVGDLSDDRAEEVVEKQANIFEERKAYLRHKVEVWE